MDLSTSTLVLIFLCFAAMAAHAAWSARVRQFVMLDPLNVFWGGLVVVYFAEAAEQATVMNERHARGTLEWAMIWVLFSILCVIIGYESRLGPAWAKRWPKVPTQYSGTRVSVAGFSFFLIGLFYYIEVARNAGGLDEWLSVGRGATDFAEIGGYFASLEPAILLGVMLLMLKVESLPTAVVERIVVWCLGILMIVWYAYLGSRSRLLLTVLGVACAYYLPRRKNPSIPLTLVAYVVLIVTSNFLAQNRGNFTNLSFNIEGSELPDLIERAAMGTRSTASLGRGSELDSVLAVVELIPNQVDFNYGYGLLEIFTRPIPSALWSEKIYPGLEAVYPIYYAGDLSDWWIETASGPVLAGPALTYVGYWYAAGGPLALLIAGVLTGALFRTIRIFYDEQEGFGTLLLYMLLLRIPFGDAISTPVYWIFTLPIALGAAVLIIRLTRQSSDGWKSSSAVPAPQT